jgi:hypothetical protein
MVLQLRLGFVVAAALSAGLSAARAQVITVKTAPIADGGQFAFLPSANLGMGGLSIALADSSLDPFVNPAKGARLRGARVFGAPTFFTVTRKAGGGLTLPLGASVSGGRWFSQLVVAMQDINRAGQSNGPIVALDATSTTSVVSEDDSKASRQNQYVHGLVGRRFGHGLSVASSASWWRLNDVDGVDLYYPQSLNVRQRGDAVDVRVGVLEELGRGQSIEAVAVHNRFAMTQDVSFMDAFWDPTLRQIVGRPRVEPNADQTDTWGLHLAYVRPLADSTWRVGAIVTGNRIRQPRLPAYELPEVPADAGRAQAYNLGGGITRSVDWWRAGLDVIYEPIWSRTWVRADEPAEARDGTALAAGATTLENHFRFQNAITRLGLSASLPLGKEQKLTFETGGQLRAMRYRLEQRDAVAQATSASTQHWNEWTRTWGVSVRIAGASLQYRGRLTTGAGRPGFDDQGNIVFAPTAATSAIAPPPPGGFGSPFGGLRFGGVRTTTHQISFSVPIR